MALLFLSGLAAYFTIARLLESQQLVIHTEQVEASIGEIDTALLRAGRARAAYVISGSEDFLRQFDAVDHDLALKLQHFEDLTRDNPVQQQFASQLKNEVGKRMDLHRQSIQLHRGSNQDQARQMDIDRQGVSVSTEISSTMQQMRDEERRLLQVRERAPRRLFVLAVVTLFCAFILALLLFSVQFRFLFVEVKARAQAEQVARDREESLRQLTGRLLQLQDAERRKFSRELHDSLGQYLVGLKMNLEMYMARPEQQFLEEAVQLLDQCISETRTISHLLHPPLLDEAGFSSAAKWYLEGFAQRSGIDVKVELPDDVSRLPKSVELGLFRVLQESLTNIHRHSESKKADVSLQVLVDRTVLEVRDYGKGISQEVLGKFQAKGMSFGVGLVGMRERIRELGGQLKVEPCKPGTLLSATIPIPAESEPSISAAG